MSIYSRIAQAKQELKSAKNDLDARLLIAHIKILKRELVDSIVASVEEIINK